MIKIPNRFTNIIGDLGEFFIKNFLEEKGIDVIGLNYFKYNRDCQNKLKKQFKKYDMLEERVGFNDEKYLMIPKGYPDFMIKDKKIFIENKVGSSDINRNQKEEFSKLIRRGFKIFIANMKLDVKPTSISISKIDWYEYNSKEESRSKGKKITWEYVKSKIKT